MLPNERKQKLERNVWMYYVYRAFSSLAFLTPVFVLFYQENGLSMTQIMVLQSIYTAVIMVFVVPAGIVADYVGRKKVLIVNAAAYTVAWAIFGLSSSFWGFLAAEITAGFSAALWMASGTAFFYDTLRELGRERSFKRRFGTVVGINYISWGIAALAGGWIATYGLRLTFWATVVTTFVAFVITFGFTETKQYQHGEKRYIAHLRDALVFTVTHRRVRLFIFYSSISFAVGFAGFMLYQPYLKGIGIPLVAFGLIYFIMNVLAAFGSNVAHAIEDRLGERVTLVLLLVAMILSFVGMTQEFYIVGAVFPIALFFSSGLLEPVLSDHINKHTASKHRATVMSLYTLATEAASTVIAPFFGWVVDAWSLTAAFGMAAAILMVDLLILLSAVGVLRKKK